MSATYLSTVTAHEATPSSALDSVRYLPSPGRGRSGRRRHAQSLRAARCWRGLPVLVGRPASGSSLTVIQWPGADERFVDLVAAVTREWDLQVIVVGTAPPPGARFVPPDIIVAAGAISLSRAIGQRLGRHPEWEVQHAKTAVAAAATYIEQHPPGMIAIPHTSHRPRARCDALELALSADVPVLHA